MELGLQLFRLVMVEDFNARLPVTSMDVDGR